MPKHHNLESIIRPKEITDIVGISLVTIWRMEKRKEFPQRKKISRAAVGWFRSDIEQWMQERVNAQ